MKLIIYSIICGFLGLISSSIILNLCGQADSFGIIIFGVIGFFSPSFLCIGSNIHD